MHEDHESNRKFMHLGLLLKSFVIKPSNWRSQKTLEEFLVEQESYGNFRLSIPDRLTSNNKRKGLYEHAV